MQQQPQQQPGSFPMTLKEAREIIPALMQFPALTVMPFMRRRIGFRVVKPGSLFGMALLLMFLSSFFTAVGSFMASLPFSRMQQPDTSGYSLVTFFALAMLILGMYQRRQRWNELIAGERWHTRCRGVSVFQFLTAFRNAKGLPYIRRDWIARFIDPIAVFIAGYFAGNFSHLLGLWLIFSAEALRITEQYLYEKQLERDLDTLDSLLEADVQSETVQHFQTRPAQERSLQETAGIPTGAGAELEARIRERKARAAAAAGGIAADLSTSSAAEAMPHAASLSADPPATRRRQRFSLPGVAFALTGLYVAYVFFWPQKPTPIGPLPGPPITNATGVWTGVARQSDGQNFAIRMELSQSADTVTGKIRKEYSSGTFALMSVTGTVAKGALSVHELAIIDQTPGSKWSCLIRSLKLNSLRNGAFTGTWDAPPCPSGQIVLIRNVTPASVAAPVNR